MRMAKSTYSQLVLILSLGLMYSQVCNVICAFSNCSATAAATAAAAVSKASTIKHGGHCHQKRTSSQKEQPPEDQHKCPAHGPAASILPSATISTVVSHYVSQTAADDLGYSFDILFDFVGNGVDRGGHFRSPPRRPLFTILRI